MRYINHYHYLQGLLKKNTFLPRRLLFCFPVSTTGNVFPPIYVAAAFWNISVVAACCFVVIFAAYFTSFKQTIFSSLSADFLSRHVCNWVQVVLARDIYDTWSSGEVKTSYKTFYTVEALLVHASIHARNWL